MAEPPTAAVRWLRDRDAIDPCLQAGLTVKMFHAAEYLQKNILGGVGSVRRIGEDAVHDAVDRLVKFSDEPGVGFLGTRLELLNNSGFLAANSYRAREFSQTGGSRHACHGDTPIISPPATRLPEWLDNGSAE